MGSRLSASLHYVAIVEQVVFLDMAKDRYFLASGKLAHDFFDWLHQRSDPATTERLFESQIVEPCAEWSPRGSERLRLPRFSALDAMLPRVSWRLALEAVYYQLLAQAQLRRKPLHQIMMPLNRRLQAAEGREDQIYVEVAAAFQLARRFVEWDRRCLSRSIAMANMLLRRNAAAQLVIGVSLPFLAHSWVQYGDRALTDPLEDLQAYSPIYRAGRS